MTAISPSTSTRLPTTALASPDLVRLLLGQSEAFAGSYPPELARKNGTARATHLRDLELDFGTAQDMVDGTAAKRRSDRRRVGLLIAGASLMMIGTCAGVALGWWQATSALSSSDLPRGDWRIQAIVPGAAVVRVGDRQWPVRAGDNLPNGDRVVMLDERGQSVMTETAVIRLTGNGVTPRAPPPPARSASSNTTPR